jgi:alanine-glyoxylate transaminase / (R)-3-amino-2-methylpropionate-pyruvate transaminase
MYMFNVETLYIHTYKLINTCVHGCMQVFFVNSGTEANELACLLARVYTGNFDMIALRNGYAGASLNVRMVHRYTCTVPVHILICVHSWFHTNDQLYCVYIICSYGLWLQTMGAGGMHTWKYNTPQGFGFHHAANPNLYRYVRTYAHLACIARKLASCQCLG